MPHLKPAEMEGKDKAWFEKTGGRPPEKRPGFSVEKSGQILELPGKSGAPFFIILAPNQCQITLKFDKEEKLSSYNYSGC